MLQRVLQPTRVLLALVVLLAASALLAGVLHHTASNESESSVVSAVVEPAAAHTADAVVATTDDGWMASVAIGCALLALCCVMLLLQAIRVRARAQLPDQTSPGARLARAFAVALSPPAAGPSIHSLSISRT